MPRYIVKVKQKLASAKNVLTLFEGAYEDLSAAAMKLALLIDDYRGYTGLTFSVTDRQSTPMNFFVRIEI